MFIGHFGVGFAAKKADPKVSLGTLFMASQFIDLLWPVFLLLGLERVEIDPGNTAFTPLDFVHYPFTHSFLGVLFWAVLFGVVYFMIRKSGKSALLLGGLVLSHWFLDLITHRPDLPLLPWSDVKAGFGLWNSVALTLLVESLIFIAGVFLYMRVTRAKNRAGSLG
ncbi:MAG: metal-dependent hydrolase, partial [Bacteroidota bacterium]